MTLMTFHVIAQHAFSNRRVERTITATDETAALQAANFTLRGFDYYVASIVEKKDA